jgi:hypothetical protein
MKGTAIDRRQRVERAPRRPTARITRTKHATRPHLAFSQAARNFTFASSSVAAVP